MDEFLPWRNSKPVFVKSEDIKATIKKATSNVIQPPKKKHEDNLVYWSIIGHRSYNESSNYEIIERLIKRSRDENDSVSMKSLIVLHNLVMNTETKNMLYLGAYFVNFSFDRRFDNVGRPGIIRVYGQYIDMLARCHVNCGPEIDIISPVKNKIQNLPVDEILKCVSSLEKIIEEILNMELPTIYCSNILIREVNRLVGLNLGLFLNSYTDSVLEVIGRIDNLEGNQQIVLMAKYYFIQHKKGRQLYDYVIRHMFNDTTTVPELTELDQKQRKILEKIIGSELSELSSAASTSSSSSSPSSSFSKTTLTVTNSCRTSITTVLPKPGTSVPKTKVPEKTLIDFESTSTPVSDTYIHKCIPFGNIEEAFQPFEAPKSYTTQKVANQNCAANPLIPSVAQSTPTMTSSTHQHFMPFFPTNPFSAQHSSVQSTMVDNQRQSAFGSTAAVLQSRPRPLGAFQSNPQALTSFLSSPQPKAVFPASSQSTMYQAFERTPLSMYGTTPQAMLMPSAFFNSGNQASTFQNSVNQSPSWGFNSPSTPAPMNWNTPGPFWLSLSFIFLIGKFKFYLIDIILIIFSFLSFL